MSPATLAYASLVPALWGLQHVVIKIGLQAFPPFSLLQTVFAVAAGAIFLHERMTWLLVTGMLVCMGGVALTQGSPPAGVAPACCRTPDSVQGDPLMNEAMHADAMLRTSDGRFAYRRMGRSGHAVMLLHGWPQTSLAWRRVAPLLAGRFDVVVPDLPGFGDSSKPMSGFDKKTIARRLREFVSGLGLSRIALVGHDLGGHVAYAYAAQWPEEVSHLIFVESSLPAFGQEEAMDVAKGGSWHFGFNMAGDISEALVRGRERVFVEHFIRRETVGLFDANAIDAAEIDHYADALARPGALRCSFSYYRALPTDRRDNRAWGETRLPMPVLAVGAANGYGPASAQTMRRVAADVHEVLIERCGHYVPEERPEALAGAIADFLNPHS